ncbi:dnaJ-like protein 60 [Daktulosphaira vitifoliae]|uniref:dnaJ-like protein 60 n=1 Tax=Daktulosphaira vitifoliae TaxID=58002 RepID=UPI0021A97982|nr:dnaJ-like protein 60 [Daktulosphaira vitifoliae]
MTNTILVSPVFRISCLFLKKLSLRYLSSKKPLISHYEVLNLKQECSKTEIRNAFLKLSKLNHPDICGPSSSAKFVLINEAYNVLINNEKRKQYDETLVYANSRNSVYHHYPQNQPKKNWKESYDDPDNYWLSSNITLASVFIAIIVVGSVIRYYGAKKSSFIRSEFLRKTDEHLLFLEEQRLMKGNKTNEELLQIFKNNIANVDIKK